MPNREALCVGRAANAWLRLRVQLAEFDQDVDHGFYLFNHSKLADAVVVAAAGREVGAGQPAERELRAVGAATDGLRKRHHVAGLERGERVVDEVLVRRDLLGHVAILFAQLNGDARFIVAAVDEGGSVEHHLLLAVELGSAVVAHDIAGRGVGAGAGDLAQVEEALVTQGVLGAHDGGQHGVELLKQMQGVHHDVAGAARVNLAAANAYGGAGGVEALVLDAADEVAVERVGVLGAEFLEVEQLAAVADLFVGGEADGQRWVGQRGVLGDAGHKLHDLGNAGLVVGGKQGAAVAHQKVLANEFGQLGSVVGVEGDVFAVDGAQQQLTAFVSNNARFDVVGGRVGAGVNVRD